MTFDVQRWVPIVVDLPTMPFDPRPPLPNEFVPDIVCDGWSTDQFHVRLASLRGYAHRYGGVTRQDAVDARMHPGTGAVVFAVADGVASAPGAYIGAESACRYASVAILKALDNDRNRIDWSALVDEVVRGMQASLRGPADRLAELFGTTLVAGLVLADARGRRGTLVQIGDSAAWLLRGERYWPLVQHKMSGRATVLNNSVVPLPHRPDQIDPVPFDLSDDEVLLIGTDGFGDPLGDGTGLVGHLFRQVLHQPPPPLGFAHALDFSRETFDDDRTLVAIWPAGRA